MSVYVYYHKTIFIFLIYKSINLRVLLINYLVPVLNSTNSLVLVLNLIKYSVLVLNCHYPQTCNKT